jgi:carotenoid cleavage oxygenase
MRNPYLHDNYAPVFDERTDDRLLEVSGAIPPDLNGSLLRNGPNPAVVPADESDYHWFSGDGMIHAISLSDGKPVGYRNRWVRTRALAAELDTALPKGPTEPLNGPANTHVIRHGGTTLALVESGLPHAVSPDLGRARVHDFDGSLGSPMTAHPKVDPETGELVFFGYDIFGPPYLRYHVADSAGVLTRTEEIEVPLAAMAHDFGVTASRVVFMDLPVLFDMTMATEGRSLPFRWMPDAGARVGVMPRDGGNGDVRWISIDPVFVFHVLNAYDDGETVIMDVIRYDRAFDTGPGEALASGLPHLARWTIDLAADRVTEQRLDDTPVEFPRIDESLSGRPHRYGYGTVLGDDPRAPSQHGLIKYDFQRDESTRFEPGEYHGCGEPVFVRASDGRNEDEGWVLSVVYDGTRNASDLVILDATSFAGPPVAVVHLPVRVPYGFHGSWVPTGS